MTETLCRIDGAILQPGEDTYCGACLDLLVADDADYIAQHIEDSADRTNRTVATVKRHWRAMVATTPVDYRVTWRHRGHADMIRDTVPVPRAIHDTNRYKAVWKYAAAYIGTQNGTEPNNVIVCGAVRLKS